MAYKNLNCRNVHRSRLLFIICFSFLMLPSLSPLHFVAHGRQLQELNSESTLQWRNEEKVEVMRMSRRRTVIGSKPPRCSERCKSCGECKAVQVPIVPIKKSLQHYYYEKAAAARNTNNKIPRFPYSRGDGISNYKPMSWKCKCGDFFFNPW